VSSNAPVTGDTERMLAAEPSVFGELTTVNREPFGDHAGYRFTGRPVTSVVLGGTEGSAFRSSSSNPPAAVFTARVFPSGDHAGFRPAVLPAVDSGSVSEPLAKDSWRLPASSEKTMEVPSGDHDGQPRAAGAP
jgi:hypothetical protein